MAKVLVLYYSAYGHIETMANAVAEGAREAGATVDIKRVPELVPEEVAKASYYKLDQAAPIAKIEDLANYDAIIVGTGTRFGRMASQMANFLDQAGGLWAKGALHGKVGGAFTSTATQHGGQETTLFSIITNLLHFGMTIVGLELRLCRPDEARRGHRRLALRRHHDHRRRRQPPAERERTRRRALSRTCDRGDREETAWLMRSGAAFSSGIAAPSIDGRGTIGIWPWSKFSSCAQLVRQIRCRRWRGAGGARSLFRASRGAAALPGMHEVVRPSSRSSRHS